MTYGVYFYNETTKVYTLLLKGLTLNGAKGHAAMYERLFNTKTIIAEDK